MEIKIISQIPLFFPLFLIVKTVKWSCYRPSVARRVGRDIALLFPDRGTRRRWVVSSTPWPHFTSGKDPVPILQEWAPGPVWTEGKSRPYRDSIPDRPARSSVAVPTELVSLIVVLILWSVSGSRKECTHVVWAHTDCIFHYRTYIVRFPSINANNKTRTHRERERERERVRAWIDWMKTL